MATSSSGRRSLPHLQRIVALLKEYIAIGSNQLKSSSLDVSHATGLAASHPLAKTPPLPTEPDTVAALQALSVYLKQLHAERNLNSTEQSSSYRQQEFSAQDVMRELKGDGYTSLQVIQEKTRQRSYSGTNETSKGCTAQTSDSNDIPSFARLQTSSAPTSRSSSPFMRVASSLACPSTPSHSSTVTSTTDHSTVTSSSPVTSINGNACSPTFSTIRIPVTNKSSNVRNHSVTSKPPVIGSNAGSGSSQTSSAAVAGAATVAVPQSELQKAMQTVNSYFPSALLAGKLNFLRSEKNTNGDANKKVVRPQWMDKRRDVISKASVDSRTRHLVRGVACDSEAVTLRRLGDLCQHLRTFPHTKGTAVKCGGVRRVLRVLGRTTDQWVAHEARAALVLLGYAGPVSGRGARILTIDGGGVRGLVAIELIRQLEQLSGKAVHEMFDFICGVSTGAIVAVLVGVHRQPPNECAQLYRELSERVFKQGSLRGATGLVINNSYYDSNAWDSILQENMGEQHLLHAAAEEGAPKLCLVACHAERSVTQAYLFRNYVLPYRVASHYNGTSNAKLWEAVRASAAAPGYFSEFRLGDKVLMDGGILVNNPAAIAVHEARQLWPDAGFQCVVSLGTGRCQPIEATTAAASSMNWGTKLRSVINSATDTEGVHTILHDLLPGNVYFRFNPHINQEFNLDEIRPDRVAAILDDTRLYVRKNATKFQEAAAALAKEKTPYHKAVDLAKRGQLLYSWDEDQ